MVKAGLLKQIDKPRAEVSMNKNVEKQAMVGKIGLSLLQGQKVWLTEQNTEPWERPVCI